MAAKPPASSNSAPANSDADLKKQIWSHEVAIGELSNLSSSRKLEVHFKYYEESGQMGETLEKSMFPFKQITQAVYQKNGNLYFRTTVPKATAFEEKQLQKLKKLNSH